MADRLSRSQKRRRQRERARQRYLADRQPYRRPEPERHASSDRDLRSIRGTPMVAGDMDASDPDVVMLPLPLDLPTGRQVPPTAIEGEIISPIEAARESFLMYMHLVPPLQGTVPPRLTAAAREVTDG